jgi:hypothetical protein
LSTTTQLRAGPDSSRRYGSYDQTITRTHPLDTASSLLGYREPGRCYAINCTHLPVETDQLRHCRPVPRVRATSARTDERGIWLGNPHRFRYLANFLRSEQRLNILNVTFLRQPTRQTFRVPPSIRYRDRSAPLSCELFVFLVLGFARPSAASSALRCAVLDVLVPTEGYVLGPYTAWPSHLT